VSSGEKVDRNRRFKSRQQERRGQAPPRRQCVAGLGLDLVLHAVGTTVDGHRLGMVKQAVEQG
jgi:hypothetical protein